MKVGLMGLGRGGRQVAEALLASSWCELVAVASVRSRRIEAFAQEHPGIAVCDDYRSLIVAHPLEALFVAVPPFLRGKYLALAAERCIPVWMLTPAARRFDEALAIIERFKQAGCPIVVARSWGVEPALQPEAIGLDQLGRVFLGSGLVMTCWAEDLDWRGDSVRAGGGVLLDRAYNLIDAMVQTMGVPSSVYMMAKGVSRPGGRFPYDTEDTAVLACEFACGAVASITACWTSGPPRWSLELHGTNGSISVDERRVVVRDRRGETPLGEHLRSANPFAPAIDEFLSALGGNRANIRSSLVEHLPTMAVIQAAYLSARTGQPEHPQTIFQMHDVKEPAAAQHP